MISPDPKTERDIALTVFQGRLGYYFSNPDNLDRALTHSSKGVENYERLEFLGIGYWDWLLLKFYIAVSRLRRKGHWPDAIQP